MSWQPFAVLHLGLAAVWFGAMAYSLVVVQPKVARFFSDERDREAFRTVLAQGNRWPVVGMTAVLLPTAASAALLGPTPVTAGYTVTLACQLAAAVVFWHVSWRHWPARVFALPAELPGFQRQLRRRAWSMCILAGAGFASALLASVTAG